VAAPPPLLSGQGAVATAPLPLALMWASVSHAPPPDTHTVLVGLVAGLVCRPLVARLGSWLLPPLAAPSSGSRDGVPVRGFSCIVVAFVDLQLW
jgi:hypothetical protein